MPLLPKSASTKTLTRIVEPFASKKRVNENVDALFRKLLPKSAPTKTLMRYLEDFKTWHCTAIAANGLISAIAEGLHRQRGETYFPQDFGNWSMGQSPNSPTRLVSIHLLTASPPPPSKRKYWDTFNLMDKKQHW